MPEINLLQNQLKDTTHVSTRRTKYVVWGSFGALTLLLVAGVALKLLTNDINKKTAVSLAENSKLQEEINNGNEKLVEAKRYQARLINIETLLRDHIALTPVLQELEKYTYQKTQFSNLNIAQDTGLIHVEGSVASYEDLGKLLLGLSTSSNFSNVKLISVAAGEANNYFFSINFNAANKLFTSVTNDPK